MCGAMRAITPRSAPRVHWRRPSGRKRAHPRDTSTSVIDAMPKRVATTVKLDTPLVRAALVKTAAEPHPSIAKTSGVQGFMAAARYGPAGPQK